MIVPQWTEQPVAVPQQAGNVLNNIKPQKSLFEVFNTDAPLITLTEHFSENEIKNEWEKLFKKVAKSIKTEVIDSYSIGDNFDGDTIPSGIVDICEKYNINSVNIESIRVERYISDPSLHKIIIEKRFF